MRNRVNNIRKKREVICIREINDNINRVLNNQPLTKPLRVLNENCEFKKRYDIACDLLEGDLIKIKQKEYRQRPEVKIKQKEYKKEYYQRPEVKIKQKEYYQRPEVKIKQKEYRQRPEVKIKKKEYRQRPEVKIKQKEYYQRRKQLK